MLARVQAHAQGRPPAGAEAFDLGARDPSAIDAIRGGNRARRQAMPERLEPEDGDRLRPTLPTTSPATSPRPWVARATMRWRDDG